MGSDQSIQLPAGAPGSNLKSQRDEDIPYTSYSISKPIDSDSPRLSPRSLHSKNKPPPPSATTSSSSSSSTASTKDVTKEAPTTKHNIVIVKDGTVIEKDPDPEFTKLNTIPVFYPIMRGSLNVPTSSRDADMLDKMNHEQLLTLCMRYQEHLRQLADAVSFDQNALCVRIKEIDCAIHMLLNLMQEKQKKHHKYADQFQRVSETLSVLNRVKDSIDNISPRLERLNQMLPESEQLEPLNIGRKQSMSSSN